MGNGALLEKVMMPCTPYIVEKNFWEIVVSLYIV